MSLSPFDSFQSRFVTYLLNFPRISDKICRENQNTHFLLNKVFFFENRVVYEIILKNTVQPDRPQMTIWRMRIACWILMVYKHTLTICNTYCFATATMVARTRLIVTFYILRCTYIIHITLYINSLTFITPSLLRGLF